MVDSVGSSGWSRMVEWVESIVSVGGARLKVHGTCG